MLWGFLLILGGTSFLAWSVLEITWLGLLRGANGSRPFVVTMLRIGHLFFLESLSFTALPFVYREALNPHWLYALLVAHRVMSIFGAFVFWQLHGKIDEFVRAAHAK